MATKPLDNQTLNFQGRSADFVIGTLIAPGKRLDSNDFFDLSKTMADGRNVRLVELSEDHGPACASVTRGALEQCDVVVSLQDGVPLPVLQAISLQIPVITSASRAPYAIGMNPNVLFISKQERNTLRSALTRIAERRRREPLRGAIADNPLANFYSDTYLWREFAQQNTNQAENYAVGSSSSRGIAKKTLLRAIPEAWLVQRGNHQRAQVALTFDDGPDLIHTPRILDMLSAYGIAATFFVVAGEAEQYPELLTRMQREGHEVGSHSYSHPYFHRLSWRGAFREIRTAATVLHSILGVPCKLFRPPHGKLALRSLLPAWLRSQRVILWSVDFKDYCAAPGQVEARLEQHPLSAGDIVLYHGTSEPSLKALPHVIEAALSKGLQLTTVSNLIRA